MNKVILMGRLTNDPELRYSQSAEPMAIVRYSLAVNRRFKRQNEPDVDFINCVVFGTNAEFAGKYFKKGLMISVVGHLRINKWKDKFEQNRNDIEVVIDEQYFAESKASFESRKETQKFVDNGYNFSQSQKQPESEGFYQIDETQKSVDNGYNFSQSQKQPENEGFYPIDESVEDDDLPF